MIEFDAKIESGERHLNGDVSLEIVSTDKLSQENIKRLYEANRGKFVHFKVAEQKRRRSLNANAYAWMLIDAIAARTGAPKETVYKEYIRDLGDNGSYLRIRDDAVSDFVRAWTSKGLGWTVDYVGADGGYVEVYAYYGSSAYSTEQMGRFIDMLIHDAEEMDIPTLGFGQIKKLKEEWNK